MMRLKKFFVSLIPVRCWREKLGGKRKIKNPYLAKLFEQNFIEPSARFICPENIAMGGGIYIGEDCRFYAEGGLSIGAYTKFGQGCMILTTNHNYKSKTRVPYDHIGLLRRVEIGKNCWLGVRCLICGGVKIEDGAIVAAGAVVTKSVPKCAIVGGNPAKIIGWRDQTEYDRLDKLHMSFPQKQEAPRQWVREDGFKKYLEI